MAVSKAQLAAQMRYNAKTYDRLEIQLKKGMKDFYKQEAKSRGVGVMELFRRGVEEYIQNHPVEGKE